MATNFVTENLYKISTSQIQKYLRRLIRAGALSSCANDATGRCRCAAHMERVLVLRDALNAASAKCQSADQSDEAHFYAEHRVSPLNYRINLVRNIIEFSITSS